MLEVAVVEMSVIGSQRAWTRVLEAVSARRIARRVGAAVVTTAAMLSPLVVAPSASAQPCPDVEVVFARGTNEPPGVGEVGQKFVDALRSQIGGTTLGVYAVDYPASMNIFDRIEFARTVVDGIRDASNHIESTAANCPNTRIVLGGYSQGAVVAGFATADAIPDGIPEEYRAELPSPMPSWVASHVAAVVLFGKPSDQFMRDVGAPPIAIGPAYVDKTIDLCTLGDTICNGAPAGLPTGVHAVYNVNLMPNEAAAFAASRL